MTVKNIIPGQKIDPDKLQRARQLRHEMTPAERMLWQALRGNKLDGFHFRRQQVIVGFIVVALFFPIFTMGTMVK